MREREGDQQLPSINDGPCIQDLVIVDIERRKALGIQRYGTVLQSHNGRDALQDLYDELLDAACYIRQLIDERESTEFVEGMRERFPLLDVSPPPDECCGEGCCGD